MNTLAEITKAALALPEREQEVLIYALSSQNNDLEKDTIEEAARRDLEIEQGVVTAIPWEQVKSAIKTRLDQ